MKAHLRNLIQWLCPTHCILCHEVTSNENVCHACLQDLPWIKEHCYQCGLPFDLHHVNSTYCGRCITTPPPFESTTALFHYTPPISKFITQLKFNRRLLFANLLGKLLAEKISTLPECIIPIPLHKTRLRHRGFNQSLEIAKPIAKRLNIPIDTHSFIRSKNTNPHSQLPAKERKQNIKKAFISKRPLTAKHVAIIDDVVTTGSTVIEFSKLLKKQKVETIQIWCCARRGLD